jgi:DNA-directed RNA polymerase subunit RPC12/RpoP
VFVTIRTYDNYINANLALGKLLDAGMHAFLLDEHTVTIDPLLSLAVNGIKLVVPQEEEHTASAMLGIMEDEYRAAITCPACGSADVALLQPPKIGKGFLKEMFQRIFLRDTGYFREIYKCNACGHEFD